MKFNRLPFIATSAVLALGATASMASTIAQGPVVLPVVYSQQGQSLTGSNAVTRLPEIRVTLNADYTANDNITLTIAGATVAAATNTELNANPVDTAPPVLGNVNVPAGLGIHCVQGITEDPIIVSFVTRTNNAISLRVTQKNVANTVGVVCRIWGVNVTDPSLAVLTSVTATWTATTAITAIPFDPSNSFTIANVIDQFTSTQGAPGLLNGVVDVNAPSLRTDFLTDDGGVVVGNEDTYTVGVANLSASITAGTTALLRSVAVKLNGDFSYLDTNGGGCGQVGDASPTASAPGVNGAITVVVASNCQSVTLTDATNGTLVLGVPASYSLTFAKNGVKVIQAPQAFTSSVTFGYDILAATADTTETDAIAVAGAWTLNGFSAFVSYLPYGANISQIVYLTNKSALSGAVTITAFNEAGTACGPFSAGTINASSVKQISGLIKTAIDTCYGAGGAFTGKAAFNVVANIPASLGEVYSAYNVGGSDRGTVVNTSNGRVTISGNSTTGGGL